MQINERFTHQNNRRISVNDFDILMVLGQGSFGKVMLVRNRDSRQIYALKTLRKEALIRRNQLEHTATERNVLQHIRSPFLTQLHFAWQTAEKLYMVMDFLQGGELFHHLQREKRFAPDYCRLLTAEITLGLEALHSLDIIYRDLKPENILMDGRGHIRLTDFGLAKEGVWGAGSDGGTTTFCGTPEYLAPEILKNEGHGKAVDWWSMGTLLYEMISGLPPWYDPNTQAMYRSIVSERSRLTFHVPGNRRSQVWEQVSASTRDFIAGLLVRNVNSARRARRLGCDGDAEEIKGHDYFAQHLSESGEPVEGFEPLDWDRVYAMDYQPSFVPPPKLNVDRQFSSQVPEDSVVDSNLAAGDAHFENFTYDPSVMQG